VLAANGSFLHCFNEKNAIVDNRAPMQASASIPEFT